MPPHIVLIPGAWHSASCFDTFLPYLNRHGYMTTALTLPSVGAEPPLTSLDPEIAHIRNAIIPLFDQGHDVVVVMHSYGGFAGSAALRGLSRMERQAEGKSGGVTALVYLAAWMIDEGQSLRGSGGAKGGKAGQSVIKETDDKIWHLNPIPLLYQDVDHELAVQCALQLKHHSLPLLYALQPYAAWKHIPATYLLCRNDQTIVYERQVKLVEDAAAQGVGIKTFTCDAGHSPFLSQPELTSRVIRSSAGEDIEVGTA